MAFFMPLVTMKELLHKADREGYAVPALNFVNMEVLEGIVAAAEEMNSPAILQASEGAVKYAGIHVLSAMAIAAARKSKVPLALHLDHGLSLAMLHEAVRHGFTSLMFDGSRFSFPENVRKSRWAVRLARRARVSIELEVGVIGGREEGVVGGAGEFTDPDQAWVFEKQTRPDALAVSIGNAHGHVEKSLRIDFGLLKRINDLVRAPLVLHGSSGIPDEDIKKAISLGVRKINMDTQLRNAFTREARRGLEENPDEIDWRKYLGPGREAVKKTAMERMVVCGSEDKA